MCRRKRQSKSLIHSIFSKILDIVFLILSIAAFALSVCFAFQRLYLSQTWVDGESMYPTLNSQLVLPNGNITDGTHGQSGAGCKHVDFVAYDSHFKMKNLKRFDVVITKYADEDSHKIKRLIGLPGETIRFTLNGDLYVKSNDNFNLVEQPISKEMKEAAHNYQLGDIVLGDDEFYVLGDNRADSSDSRVKGALKTKWYIGKAIAIVGYCETIYKDGDVGYTNLKYYFTPRFL